MSDIEKANSTHQNYDRQVKFNTPPPMRIANPGALGLFSFASTTFILSLYNVNARGVAIPNVVVGMACFCGGLAQLLAGMWEFPRGNVFGATAFTSYGAFWMSYATIFIPNSGILVAYDGHADELSQALGIYLITWFVVTFLLMLGALRRNVSFVALLFFLCITFVLLAIGAWNASVNLTKAGGAFGILTAMIAYYCGLSELLVKGESWFGLPLGTIKQERVD